MLRGSNKADPEDGDGGSGVRHDGEAGSDPFPGRWPPCKGNGTKWGWRIVRFFYPTHTSFACSGLQLPENFFWKDLTIPRWFAKVGAWRATCVDTLIENLKSTLLLLLARLGCDLRAVFCLGQNACAVLRDCVPS